MDRCKRVDECRKYGVPPAALFIEDLWDGDELKSHARVPIFDPTEEIINSFRTRRAEDRVNDDISQGYEEEVKTL